MAGIAFLCQPRSQVPATFSFHHDKPSHCPTQLSTQTPILPPFFDLRVFVVFPVYLVGSKADLRSGPFPPHFFPPRCDSSPVTQLPVAQEPLPHALGAAYLQRGAVIDSRATKKIFLVHHQQPSTCHCARTASKRNGKSETVGPPRIDPLLI